MTPSKRRTGNRLSNYRRLLGMTRPYRLRMTVGIVAGILSAGTFFSLLSFLPNAFSVFEHVEERKPALSAAADLELDTLSADQEETKELPVPSTFAKVENIASRFNIPLRNPDNTLTWQALFLSMLGVPIFIFLRILTSLVNQYYMRWVGTSVIRDLRDGLFSTLQHQSLGFFGNCDIGQLISRCVNDTASIESVISVTIAEAARAPFEILAAVLVAVTYAIKNEIGYFLLVACVILPLCLVPVIILGNRVRRWTRRALERISILVSRMHENFTGIRVVKAFHTEVQEAERFQKMNHSYFQSSIRALQAELLMTPFMELVITVLVSLFALGCFIYKIRLEQITVIGVSLFAAYRPMKQVARINGSIQRGAAALARIFDLLDTDTALPESPNAITKDDFTEIIRFENVNFGFSEDGPTVVDGVSLELRRGSLLALVGETGSGKTTIANLLARFYDPLGGRITMDGIDLREIATESLRRLIGVVTQDTILFNDSIANNIAYGSTNATQEEIESAAKMANAHDFIIAHPAGYQRNVGDKGFLLSGGEKQRVALARAILRNPPILILDEATSALDTVTERLVQAAIAQVMTNRTTLAIAHRLSTVRRANQILVIDGGRIIESGTHDELYAQMGRYRHLCDMQLSD